MKLSTDGSVSGTYIEVGKNYVRLDKVIEPTDDIAKWLKDAHTSIKNLQNRIEHDNSRPK